MSEDVIIKLQKLYESGAEFSLTVSQDPAIQVQVTIGPGFPPAIDRRFSNVRDALSWLTGVSLTRKQV
jgi:hypothetical protein